MKKHKIRSIAALLTVILLFLWLPVGAASPEEVPEPCAVTFPNVDSSETVSVCGSDKITKATCNGGNAADYGFTVGNAENAQSYTVSFSAMTEADCRALPILLCECGTNAAGQSVNSPLLKIDGTGRIFAFENASSCVKIGRLSSDKLTDVSVTVDRSQAQISFFVDTELVFTARIRAGEWLGKSVAWDEIRQCEEAQSAKSSLYFGNCSLVKTAVGEEDYSYFALAFPNLGDRLDSMFCTVSASLSLSFRMILCAEDPKVGFKVGEDGKTEVSPVKAENSEFTAYGKTYAVYDAVLGNLGAQNVSDTVTVEVTDGETAVLTAETSLKAYLDTLLEKDPENEKLASLIDALLYYANETKSMLEKEPSAEKKTLSNVDFDEVSATVQTTLCSAAVAEEATANKVLKITADNTAGEKSVILKNAVAGMAPGKRYLLSFRYRSDTAREFTVGYGSQSDSAVLSRENGTAGVWNEVSKEFICSYTLTENADLILGFDGAKSVGILIDDIVLYEIVTPGFVTIAGFDVDTAEPIVTTKGLEAGASLTAEKDGGNLAYRLIGYKDYAVFCVNGVLKTATSGKHYRLTFRYKVERRIGEGDCTVDIGYASGNGYSGGRIVTERTSVLGEWHTAYVDFIYDSVFTPADVRGMAITVNGLGSDPSGRQTYSIWFDDFTLSEMAHRAPVAAAEARPVNTSGTSITSANVLFTYQNRIAVKFTAPDGIVPMIDGKPADYSVDSKGVKVMETEGIAPTDFNKKFVFTVGNSVLKYSLNDYIAAKRQSDAIGRLAKAMYAYGTAAEAYLAD